MAKQLNVNLAFTADTSKAKAQLQDLQNQLTKLVNQPFSVNGSISDEIEKATVAAAELKVHLQNATNVNTGTLDFSKLNQSIKTSGSNLNEYAAKLRNLGPEGQKAFMSLTQSVIQAEIPIRRSNKLLSELWVTMKNTARWQLTSSMMHGFMGAVSSAYGYAQDLNESLNNIRIVTGKNIEDMSRFADEANRAAKALSTTTTAYTDASLIYYQQGLSDTEVAKRTEVTVKMANAAGQSAQIVSDQLTAVWNNFYDGSKSLEYYADVMTALGAATASSTDEIAGGLEKFAAVGETIGLSYEYAASALATITSNTRQSEEVVGTALKTIFARIQGLNLGETLEDGTTLNKYSQALEKVGISIFESNGEIKKMDSILDEMAAKWQTLAKDQQIALAQTVAGVRQYTQLVSLMDNWDAGDSDSMMANLATARGSSGALDEQAKIYEESWKAASKRVQAALEGIYDTLIDDEAFIVILNNLEKVITHFDNLIDTVGGLRGILTIVGSLMTKLFASQMAAGLTNLAYNMKMMTAKGRQSVADERSAFIKEQSEVLANMEGSEDTVANKTASDVYSQQLQRQQQLIDNQEHMNDLERQTTQILMDQLEAQGKIAIEKAKAVDKAQEKQADTSAVLYQAAVTKSRKDKDGKYDSEKTARTVAGVRETAVSSADLDAELSKTKVAADKIQTIFTDLKAKLEGSKIGQMNIVRDEDIERVKELTKKLAGLESTDEEYAATLAELRGVMGGVNDAMRDRASEDLGADLQDVDNYANAVRNTANANRELKQSNTDVEQSNERVSRSIENAKGAQATWADVLVASANVAMNVASVFQMLGGIVDTLADPDLTGWEKFLAIMSTVAMIIPMVVSVYTNLSKAFQKDTLVKTLNTIATKLNTAAVKDNTNAQRQNANTVSQGSASWKDVGKSAGEAAKGLWNFVKANIGAIAAVAAAALIIAGAAAAFMALSDAYNKDAIAAAEAQKAAESLAQSYADAQNAYNDLKNTVSSYEQATQGIDSLTRGTVEFREKVLEANSAAMQLINTMEDVQYTIDSDGLIRIDEGELERIQNEQLAQLEKSQRASLVANQNADNAQLTAQKTEYNRTVANHEQAFTADDKNTTGRGAAIGTGAGAAVGVATGLGMAAAGMSIGAATGSVVPIVGTAIGAVAGLIIGGVVGAVTAAVSNDQTETEQKALDAMADYYAKNGDATFTEEGMKQAFAQAGLEWNQALADSMLADENIAATKELIQAMHQNTLANEMLNKQIVSSALQSNDKVQNSRHGDKVVDAIAEDFDSVIEAERQKLTDDGWGTDGIAKIDGANQAAKDVFETYAKAAGLDLDKVKLTDTTGTDDNRKFVYEDAEGKEQTISLDDMKTVVATQKASEAIGASAEKLAETFNKLSDSQMAATDAVLTGNYKDLSLAQIQNGVDASSFGFTQADLENMGYATLAEFQADLDNAIVEANNSWSNTLKNYSDLASGHMQAIGNSNVEAINSISQASVEAYGKMLEGIQTAGGDDTANAMADSITKIMEKNSSKAQDIMNLASGIDWSKGEEALQEFNYQLLQMGINIDENSQEWQAMVMAMQSINTSVVHRDLDKIREDLVQIKEIAGDIEIGDIISDEDYDTLIRYKAELADMFMLTAEGYKYLGGGNLSDIASGMALEQLQQTKDNNKEAIAAYNAINAWGWNTQAGGFEKEDWYGLASGTDSNERMSSMATALADSNPDAVAALGYDPERLKEVAAVLVDPNATQDQVDKAKEILQGFYGEILTLNENYENEVYDDTKAEEMYASTAQTFGELQQMFSNEEIGGEAYGKAAEAMSDQMINNAASLKELYEAINESEASGVEVTQQEKADALIRLGEEYSNCADEVKEYQKALQSANKDEIAAAEDALEAAIMVGEAADKYGLDADVLEAQAKQIRRYNKDLKLTEKQAANLAIANQRMNKGVKALNENFEDWKKTLTTADKTSMDYAEALTEVESAIGDLVGASDDFELPEGFLDAPENLALIERAAKGDEAAINQLGLSLSSASIKALEFNESLAQMYNEAFGGNIDLASFETAKQTVLDGIAAIQANMAGLLDGSVQITDVLGENWVASLNEMAIATGMSVEQMNGLLNQLGVQAKVEVANVPQDMEVPMYVEQVEPTTITTYDSVTDQNGNTHIQPNTRTAWAHYTVPAGTKKVRGIVQVAQISTEGGDIGSPTISYTGVGGTANGGGGGGNRGGGVSPSATGGNKGGGGGSKNEPKTASAPSKMDKEDETHKSTVVKRYKELDDKLDDLADSYERANREADQLFGEDKLKAIEKENKLLQEQQKLIEKKAKEAKKYMASDRAELDEAAREAGLNFSYDEKGNITNYTDQMTNLHNQLAAAENEYNRMVDEYNAAVDAAVAQYGDELPEELADQLETKQQAIEAYEENVLSRIRDTITSVEDAMELYEESKELYEELGLEAEDIANQIKENNYRIISEGLELRITLNEDDLELIEYQLGKLEDDFYSMAESIALMVGSGTANLGGDGTQLGEYIDNLNHYKNTMEELERAYAAGEITEASYIEGMKEVRSGMLENLQSIQELDDAMMNYYEETLAAGQEELDKYTSKMEHQTAVLEHYMSIMEILGKSQDYESLGVILEAQAKSIGNEAKVAKENYEMLKAQADAKKAAYEAASTPEEAEMLKKEWEAAQVAANEAQDEMLSKTEQWAEAMTAVAQNKLKGLGQALEDALTAGFGGSFDAMTTAMERANSLQEEYLTTTNQIYETNKLMHTAQKEIEKTSNDVAKRKMKDFITETKQLQDQTKLSKYELDIQKGKYDLLLAEIALEEAQSAKSTVRLQRDSEGNFGYVYTADKTAVDNAQQAFEDAQNNLYNIGLEGTNNYTQKYQETLNEFYDTMTSLQEQYLNGEFQNEEEYQAAMQSAREFYYAKLQEYSSLNSVALSTDARVVEDAWTKEFRGMTQQTDLWMQNVDGYVRNVMGVFDEWQTQMAEVRKTTVGPDLVALKENTQEIVKASDALAEAVTKDGGVIDALEKEYNAVSKITGAYAQYRDIIADLITQYDGFMGRITTTVNTAAGTGNSSPTPGPEGFASGGYTGEWGPGGKLAMLHQKELILKEGDTENFLASLEVLRDIVKVIDLHAMNAQLGGLLNSPQYHDYEGTREVLEQQVHIEASFPNVSDRHEIEEALTTLVNKASQFTGRL